MDASDFGMDALIDAVPTKQPAHNITSEVDNVLKSMRQTSEDIDDVQVDESDDAMSVLSSQAEEFAPQPTYAPQRVSMPRYDTEDLIAEKREILYQFDRLHKKGFKLPRQFNMTSDLAEILPGMDQVLKENPALMKQFASAAMGTMAGNVKEENRGVGNIASGLAGFMSNIFGGGGDAPPREVLKPVGKMRGPSVQQRIKGGDVRAERRREH
eukprot:gene19704-26395_t